MPSITLRTLKSAKPATSRGRTKPDIKHGMGNGFRLVLQISNIEKKS